VRTTEKDLTVHARSGYSAGRRNGTAAVTAAHAGF
jgi:hypothetical protein